MYRDQEKASKIVSLKQFMKDLTDYTEKILHEKFQWNTVEEWILALLKRHVEDIVLAALGYRREHGRGWCLDLDKRSGITNVLYRLATDLAEKHFPKILADAEAKIVKNMLSKNGLSAVVKEYEYRVQMELRDRMAAWAEEHATADVEALFEKNEETLLDAVKLKRKLTMDSLVVIADDDSVDDDNGGNDDY
jgi:hypothetical protein